LAAEKNHVETLLKMWVWAEETQLNPKELKKKLFLSKRNYGYNAWHRAAQFGSLEALETLWSLAKEVELDTEELLLSQTGEGYTAFHLAAETNHVETLLKMWVWAEETQLNPKVLKKNLFLAKDNHGSIAWHLASLEGNIEALEALWVWAKKVELKADELLLAQNGDGFTAFQMAAKKKSCRSSTENVGMG
jgi:ankyrin repeat protein